MEKEIVSQRKRLILYEILTVIAAIGIFIISLQIVNSWLSSLDESKSLNLIKSTISSMCTLAIISFSLIVLIGENESKEIDIALNSTIVGICVPAILVQVITIFVNGFNGAFLIIFLIFAAFGITSFDKAKTRTKTNFERLSAMGGITVVAGVIMIMTLTL